jgi:hypothetical protein
MTTDITALIESLPSEYGDDRDVKPENDRDMKPANGREVFRAAYLAERAATEAVSAFRKPEHPLQVALVEEVTEAMRAKLGKKSRGKPDIDKAKKVLDEAAYQEIVDRHSKPATEAYQAAVAHMEACREALYKLAPEAEVKIEEGAWKLLDSRWASTYRTTNSGEQYAQCSAEFVADRCRAFNVPVEVRRVERERDRWHERHDDFEIYAAVAEDLDIVILKHKSDGMTLREWVKRCWARGCQPRVFHPFLDPDFEAKNGLDYFGGEKKVPA